MGEAYDVIIVGGGHNGLTAAAYLAMGGEKDGRNKLKVLVLERYRKPGGAAMSDEIYPGFTYSTCSYVCSLLRPEIMRDLDLPRHGLQVMPYEGGAESRRRGIVTYRDHDRTRESRPPFSMRDAETYDHYAAEIMRQCRFIRPLLMRHAAGSDAVTLPPSRSPGGAASSRLPQVAQKFPACREKQMYDMIRFWTMSIADYLDEYFETPAQGLLRRRLIIGTALGPMSPGTAYVLLHHTWATWMATSAPGAMLAAAWVRSPRR